jgi:hypothetical protein
MTWICRHRVEKRPKSLPKPTFQIPDATSGPPCKTKYCRCTWSRKRSSMRSSLPRPGLDWPARGMGSNRTALRSSLLSMQMRLPICFGTSTRLAAIPTPPPRRPSGKQQLPSSMPTYPRAELLEGLSSVKHGAVATILQVALLFGSAAPKRAHRIEMVRGLRQRRGGWHGARH